MSMSDSRARLLHASKQLTSQWQQTKESWRDTQCQQFEKTTMIPLDNAVRSTLMAMEQLGSCLSQAQHECQDRGGLDQ